MRPLRVISLCSAAAAIAMAGALWGADRPPAATVATLDRLLMERFERLDNGLGISRMVTTPQHSDFARFNPESAAEKAVVRDLESGEWDAVFYVAGRAALSEAVSVELPTSGTGRARHYVRRVVSPPTGITRGKPRAPLPADATLLREAKAAFGAFARAKGHAFTAGEWSFTARPIVASNQKCLSCHQQDEKGKKLALGATLGVAFYGFAPAGPGRRQPVSQAPPPPRAR